MFKTLREVEDLLRGRPGSKKEDEELTKSLHNYIKNYPNLTAQIYYLCREKNCLGRIKEAVKSNYSPYALAPLLFKDLSDIETVEVLICCPKFLDAFLLESVKGLKEYWELWRFIYDPDTDDILQRSLRLIRLNLFYSISAEHRETLIKLFFTKILEKYVQKDELHLLEVFEIRSYYEYSKANEELLGMWKEICITQSRNQESLAACGICAAEEFYLGALDQTISSEDIVPFLQMENLKFIASVNYFVNCPGDPKITDYVKPIVSEPTQKCKLNIKTIFFTPELSVAKFILSEEFTFDPCQQYPEWSLKYCFLRAQIDCLNKKDTGIMSGFIFKYPKYFDHGLSFLSLVKGVHEMGANELRALVNLSVADNYQAREIFTFLGRYVNPLAVRIASEYSYISHALRLVKNHFDALCVDSNQRAEVIENLVNEDKASQSTLESCLYYLIEDIKNHKRKEVWPQYLRTLRHLVDVRLVSPVLLWSYLLKPHIINDQSFLQGVFFILETLCLIPLVTLSEEEGSEDFDESVKEPVSFIVDTINQQDVASPFAFKALCTLPDQMIKRLVPVISNELLCKILIPETVDALAKYAFMEIQSMPRTFLLGTTESNSATKREHIDLSWFQSKKCAHSWFLDDLKLTSVLPLLSIPFTLRQVLARKIISHFTEMYATQKDPKLINSNDILISCCSTLAFSRVTGTAGKMFVDLQCRILEELNKYNVDEEEIAVCLLSLKLFSDEGEALTDATTEKIEQIRMKKFLDPTVVHHFSCEGITVAQTEFKGFEFFLKGTLLSKEELKAQLMELIAQPMAIGLINALSLAIGYSSSKTLEKDIVVCVNNRIPEIAFKQAKFSIWIDAFYFCIKDSNNMKEKLVTVSEPGYERIGQEYIVRLLLDRKDELSLMVLTKCDHLPRINWSFILTGSEEELIMKHLISRIVKDNPFVSPSLKHFALRLYEREQVSDLLINSLATLVEATDKKTSSKLLKCWDLNQINIPLLVESAYFVGLDLVDVEVFILSNEKSEYYELLAKFNDSNQPLTMFARLMSSSSWTLAEFEKLIQMGITADQLVIYNNSPKVEFVDVILSCLKMRDKPFATALLKQCVPFKNAIETLLWNALIMETPVPKRKRILALL